MNQIKFLKAIPYYRICGITEWRMVKGHPRYSVSCDGEVLCWKWHRTGKPRLCRLSKDNKGYLLVKIDGVNKKIHRLVAEAFIPNPQNKKEVDHINTIRNDNRVENLRWVTHLENSNNPLSLKHYSENARKSMLGKFGAEHNRSIPIVQLSLEGQFIKKWGAAADVERELGIDPSGVSACCRGRLKQTGGFRWVYASEFKNSSKNVIKTKMISDIRPLF